MRVNATLLVQAIVKLIENTIKYSYEKLQFNILIILEKSELVIAIKDQGSGIDARHLDRIF